jgi:hypothetical protein
MIKNAVCLLCDEEYSDAAMAKAEKEHPEWPKNPSRVFLPSWSKAWVESHDNIPKAPCVVFDIYCHGEIRLCEEHLKKLLKELKSGGKK